MKIRLSSAALARQQGCICPVNRQQQEYMHWLPWIPVIMLGLLAIDGLVALLFGMGWALFLAITYFACALVVFLYRLIRGHTLRCAYFGAFLGGLQWIGVLIQSI